MPAPRRHPHFDDQGTLDWHTRWADAVETARREQKLVFIDMGRELCSQCRTLVQSVVPHPQIAPVLKERFVALAADADESEDEVLALAEHLEDAYMLPFVIFADPSGKFLGGSSGATNPLSFRRLIDSIGV
ncbi:MAG: thioredoxin family protein [Planctomycetes bacterium]|nr:thioredoxin family protein [Planctomycetota bacterium]